MALIVETGAGLTTANSYISVADADVYHADYGNPDSWSSATATDKEEALRIGTRYIDSYYYGQWIGCRGSGTQALEWPRIGATKDGYYLSASSVPSPVQNAAAIAALQHIEDASSLFPIVDDTGTIKKTSVTVGPISELIEYTGGKTGIKKFTEIESILKGYIHPGTFIDRG